MVVFHASKNLIYISWTHTSVIIYSEATFTNKEVEISDLYPQNVLKDKDGDLYVVDAEFRKVIQK